MELKGVAVFAQLYVLHPLRVGSNPLSHQRQDAMEIVVLKEFVGKQEMAEEGIVTQAILH